MCLFWMLCLSCVGQQWTTSPDIARPTTHGPSARSQCMVLTRNVQTAIGPNGIICNSGTTAFSRFCHSLGAYRDRRASSIKALSQAGEAADCYCSNGMRRKKSDDRPDLRRVRKWLGSLEPSTLFEVQDCGMFLPCGQTLPGLSNALD
jgi:hypothetical protein